MNKYVLKILTAKIMDKYYKNNTIFGIHFYFDYSQNLMTVIN
jgi:hypothetical protein